HPTSITTTNRTTTYTTHNRDRLTTNATPLGTLTYTYNLAGAVTSIASSNANGVSVAYDYDELNRLKTVTDNRLVAPNVTTYTYNNVGSLVAFVYPNGVEHAYSYNTLNRLTHMSMNTGATPLSTCTYALGLAGNRSSVTDLTV